MSRREYEEFDPEDPDQSDMEEDDDPALVACPYCHKPISEDAEICPRCRNFISQEGAPPRRHPWWVWIGAILCLIGVLLCVF
jgi:predicted nucleic acid-binding Zn ribbon protein